MVINLTGEINESMLSFLVDSLKDYTMNDKPLARVMINSGGGDVMVADAICDIIEDIQVPLVAYKQISSAALYLFMKCNTERSITKNTFGVYHRSSMSVPTNEDGTIKHGAKSTIEAIQKVDTDNSLQEDWMEMTSKERSQVYDYDGDLGLDTARLNMMLQNSIDSNYSQVVEETNIREMLKVATALLENVDATCKKMDIRDKRRKKIKKVA